MSDTQKSILEGIKNAASVAKNKTADLLNKSKDSTVKWLDQNGDGVLTAEDMICILDGIYGQAIEGNKFIKSVNDVSNEYLERYKDARLAAKKLIAYDVAKCTTSGFINGLGGLITLPLTIPANISSVLFVQLRMIASIAKLAGLDVNSDATRTVVYACLAGMGLGNLAKSAGISFGTKLTNAMIAKIPGKTLTAINKKVGFRFITKFGEKGILNLGKMVPIVGGIISGGADLTETTIIANRSLKCFFDGITEEDKEDEENTNPDIIDAEFTDIVSQAQDIINQQENDDLDI